VALAKIYIVRHYVEPIPAIAFPANYTCVPPALEHSTLDMAARVKVDGAVGPHRIVTEKLVLNLASCLGNYCCRTGRHNSPLLNKTSHNNRTAAILIGDAGGRAEGSFPPIADTKH